MMRGLRRYASLAVPGAVLVLVLALRILDPGGVLEEVRLRVFDTYQRLAPREAESSAVRVVDIDDESLSRIGQWPWPRTLLADLISHLTKAGAVAIGLDVIFPEPDRTSPAEVLKLWPHTEGLKPLLARLPDHDLALADALAASPSITGFVLTTEANGRVPVRKGTFAHAGIDPAPFIPGFSGAVGSLPVLERAARGNGSINSVPDRDGILRRVPLVLRLGDRLYASLVTETLRVAQRASTSIIRASGAQAAASFGAETGIDSIKVGEFVVPTDAHGQFWLHYATPSRDRTVSAWRVLNGEAGNDAFDGTIVLIGTSAAGLKDLRPSPLDPAMPGIEAHAQAVEQILSGRFLGRPDWAEGAELLYVAALGLALVLALRRIGAAWSAVVGAAAAVLAVAASWQVFRYFGFLIDPATPVAATLAVYIAATLVNFLATEREKREVRTAFSQYLAPAMVERLASDPSQLKLGGETRDMTFLFCDVRGFTTISESFKSDPQALTRLINRFLTPMTDAILAKRGTIDKYMGDCIMAFWNAPLDDRDHSANACRAALVMRAELVALNGRLAAEAEKEGRRFLALAIGIGLNSGNAVVGNMGSDQRFDYSVLGDAVNLASRLEGQSKTYGVDIVVGETTKAAAPGFAYLELDLIAVKGKLEAVRIHALRAAEPDEAHQALSAVQDELLAAYRAQQWDRAASAIERARTMAPDLSALWDLYTQRIADYRRDPPGADWDGVTIARTK
ncbi:MAG: adenylate/guanylate cyclase domain-containing protein [Alphaproteobacteria bacterium]|nr:adenylate/guanylate cyclase domain-containing protein [Alphaproteobacteria bacterium]